MYSVLYERIRHNTNALPSQVAVVLRLRVRARHEQIGHGDMGAQIVTRSETERLGRVFS